MCAIPFRYLVSQCKVQFSERMRDLITQTQCWLLRKACKSNNSALSTDYSKYIIVYFFLTNTTKHHRNRIRLTFVLLFLNINDATA